MLAFDNDITVELLADALIPTSSASGSGLRIVLSLKLYPVKNNNSFCKIVVRL